MEFVLLLGYESVLDSIAIAASAQSSQPASFDGACCCTIPTRHTYVHASPVYCGGTMDDLVLVADDVPLPRVAGPTMLHFTLPRFGVPSFASGSRCLISSHQMLMHCDVWQESAAGVPAHTRPAVPDGQGCVPRMHIHGIGARIVRHAMTCHHTTPANGAAGVQAVWTAHTATHLAPHAAPVCQAPFACRQGAVDVM